MPEINVLSKEISELIAAGEVIERPSSVIKELVENSIDSGASHITVEIKNGGTTYMRVTDDGCGISCDDVPKAFLRHATSKVVSKEDLNKICTLGFRGEALASISAVARVELLTKQKDDTYGTLYRIEGSEEVSCERSGCPDGTTIIIRELFYNVPARRKFMKKDVTEANSISQILQKIALSHPETSFKLIRDNRVEFNSSGDGELYSAIYSVYGRDFARDLIPVDHCYNDIRISGYAVKPLYARNNRSFQNFFVNGRYVKSRICSAALESAFHNMIMTGKFPACVLMIDMPPADMDVNIHPAKAEVRFVNEKNVSDAIFFAIKNALVENGLLYEFELKTKTDWTAGASEPAEEPVQQELMFTPVDKIEETEKNLNMTAPEAEKAESQPPSQTSAEKSPVPFFMQVALEQSVEAVKAAEEARNADNYAPEPEQIPADITAPEPADNLCENITAENFRYINSRSFEAPVKEKTVPQPAEPVPENKPAIRVIGEAFKNYIMAEADNSIIMIDKHAAHERIIFERLKSRNCRQYSQMLMTEIRVLLPLNEFDALENNRELLADMGFEFDFSQKPYAAAKAVPTFLMELDMDEIIPEIAENLCLSKQDPQTHIFDDMLHTIACKSAIKANDTNDIRELQALAEQVYADEK
ncbi:MAG: DNA mismatch repair endonuclease MutL, partial [Oscillospiraceae bacterium]|nr:DNA mismatch repair endonuclease MutL [Oscillospiraceae bacterium]